MEVESHFFDKLNHALNKWPDNVKWSLYQLASYTTYDPEWVARCLGKALNKNLVVDDRLSREDVLVAFERLKTIRENEIKEQHASQQESFAKIKHKIQTYARQKKWQQAYQTCSYYLGNEGGRLSFEELTYLQDECIRLGTKCERSIQELFVVLKAQEKAALNNGAQALADFIDMIDAYEEYFCRDQSGIKQLLLLIDGLSAACQKHQLETELKELKLRVEQKK